MNKNNIIIINGRHYDAKTGEALSGQPHHAAAPAHTAAVRGVVRQTAGHARVHPPKPSQTLMRQAVKKPSADLKRRIKVQGHLDSSAGRASSKIIVRSSDRQPNIHHLQHVATKRAKGRLISHFSPELFEVDSHTPAITYGAAAVQRTSAHAPTHPIHAKKPRTTAELLEYAVQQAKVPEQPLPRKHHRKLFKRHV